MQLIPADWTGVYQAQSVGAEDPSLLEQLFQQCFRLERLNESRLLVASEYRLHEKDIPRLRNALDEQKTSGDLLDYELSENMILCTVAGEDGSTEQQYTALLKKGPWYILTQTIAPVQLFDLKSGNKMNFDLKTSASMSSPWLPWADSISSEQATLVARQTRKHWYFNTWEANAKKWSLLYVEQTSKDQLLIKQSHLQNPEAFKMRLDYFNRITPFREVDSDNFEIDPTDEALEQLLAEKDMFQTTYLRRIEE
ncbi:MAG: hypothetical protein H6574_09575 [Lewinellaceae bacterium]|nr:hypothetical protein [Saprospiraceae bacterium]MCB9331319.1 hypothetical protein [Lewinellaceae bacterium]